MGLLDNNIPDLGEQDYVAFLDKIRRLQVSGGYQTMNDGNVKASSYGGRVGYNIPQGSDNLNLGLSGAGFNAKGSGFNVGNRQVTGADLTYEMPNSTVSLRYDKMGMMPQPIVDHPMADYEMQRGIAPAYKDLLQLIYRKQF